MTLNPFTDLPHILGAGPARLLWHRCADDGLRYALALWLIHGRDL